MRLKARHLLIRIIYDDGAPDPNLSLPQLAKAIQNQVESNFGDFGGMVLKFGYQLKYFNPVTGLGILRIPRDNNQLVVYSITAIKKLAGKPCKIDILYISGTIKKCQFVAIELSRSYLKDLALKTFLAQQSSTNSTQSNAITSTPTTTPTTTPTSTTNPPDTFVLTTDGDILPDANIVSQISTIEQEIMDIDNVVK